MRGKRVLSGLRNEKGSLLLVTYFVVAILLGIGAAFLMLVSSESRIAERQRLTTIAFHITEAGVEKGLYELKQDFINASGTPSWSDGDINGYSIGPDTADFYTIPYSSTSLNDGTYLVELKNVAGSSDDIWIRSTGTISGVSHTISIYTKMVSLSSWEYAIFAGSGATGTMINGVVDIRGSVIVLGDGLADGDYAMDLGGTAEIVGNNYSTLDAGLLAKVPPLPTTTFNGEVVETLNAELRVKKGLVGLSGASSVGEIDVSGNSVKETVDAVYVTDGWGGNQGANQVFSDNGSAQAYDLEDAMAFPSLSDPYPGYADYQDYLKNTGYVLTAAEAATLANLNPNTPAFAYGDANGSISMDGTGNLAIDGIVYLDNDADLVLNKDGTAKTVTYTGSGSILVTGNVHIDASLVTAGNNSFPTNIMGIMTPKNISFTDSDLDVMGLFYAENSVIAQKQTDIVGTIVSNYFDMGTNVPAIYQVPEVANNLPPGLIGADARWYMVVAWLKS